MIINPKEKLFGHPLLKIRDLLRFILKRYFIENDQLIKDEISKKLKLPSDLIDNLIEQMILEDYLQTKKDTRTKDKIVLVTEKGNRLAVTRANPPITRIKADLLLKELLERVIIINANNDLAYKVESIKVFGSFLSDKDILGDIDILFKLVRNGDATEYKIKSESRLALAKHNGQIFHGVYDHFYWPHTEVLQLLKTKKKGLSLHNEDDDGVADIVDSIIVYENGKLV